MKLLRIIALLVISQQANALEALTVNEVSQGIYVHFGKHQVPDTKNHGAIANIGFIVGKKCVAVIDSGGNPTQGAALKKAITQTTSTPVCYVINTHVHPDHIYGNRAFKTAGVEFVGHHKLARAMAVRRDYYLDKAAESLAINLNIHDIIPPTINVEDHLTLDLGGRKLELTAHPTAHTDNDLSIYDKQTQTLWLSDLLFREHIPVLDGSINGWLAELARLEKQSYDYVIPGHGALVTDWKHSLQPQKRYLTLLRDEIRVMIKQGKFLEEAVESVAYSEKNRWKLFEQFHRKNITAAFAELEWED
ncbi:MAG: quinoprotein relay system zinc metallohydrolase 2 [Methylococcales bacterium]|nr:quinoprotein relay system zinc metallohydrolase 2 [Methylococcales bacterium]